MTLYKGKKIIIKDKEQPLVEIDGKPIRIFYNENKEYETNYLPYTTYKSILDLCKSVIDNVPGFSPKKIQGETK